MKIQNKIGLEAEFFLFNKDGELVYPATYGFSHDEFPILGEFRANPGTTREETMGEFVKALYQTLNKASSNREKLQVSFSGYVEVSPKKKAEILRRAGAKYMPPCENIYKTDILELSDDVVDQNGKILRCRLSLGLHVHFSRRVYHEGYTEEGLPVKADIGILTDSQVETIIREMDKSILPKFSLNVPLKYRSPGFYEKKPWGFEYRSLPMIEKFTELPVLNNLVDFSFSLLEKLEK